MPRHGIRHGFASSHPGALPAPAAYGSGPPASVVPTTRAARYSTILPRPETSQPDLPKEEHVTDLRNVVVRGVRTGTATLHAWLHPDDMASQREASTFRGGILPARALAAYKTPWVMHIDAKVSAAPVVCDWEPTSVFFVRLYNAGNLCHLINELLLPLLALALPMATPREIYTFEIKGDPRANPLPIFSTIASKLAVRVANVEAFYRSLEQPLRRGGGGGGRSSSGSSSSSSSGRDSSSHGATMRSKTASGGGTSRRGKATQGLSTPAGPPARRHPPRGDAATRRPETTTISSRWRPRPPPLRSSRRTAAWRSSGIPTVTASRARRSGSPRPSATSSWWLGRTRSSPTRRYATRSTVARMSTTRLGSEGMADRLQVQRGPASEQ